MATVEPRILKGFRDYLPDQMIPRKRLMDAIERIFERYGFAPLQTPALEYAEILLGKYGADAERLLYRFSDQGGRDVCLRYDLTVPLARVAAQHPEIPLPFKRYQIAPVWRAEKPGKGRFREFFQCDVDVVGTASLLADAECIAVDNDVLSALDVKNFRIRINNRKVLTGMLHAFQLGSGEDEPSHAILRTLDKLTAMGAEAVRHLLASENHLDAGQIEHLFQFLDISGGNEEILAAAERLIGSTEAGRAGLAELRSVVEAAALLGVPGERLAIDLSIARGLDYYTGSVFETFLLDLPGFGSVMSGGRYDNLISVFLGRPMPAVGISVGIDRLFSGMVELGLVETVQSVTRVLVAPMGAAAVATCLAAATRLRAAGIPTEVYVDDDKLAKQLRYANRRGVPLVVIIGEDEVAAGQATLKVMKTGEQVRVPFDELPGKVASVAGLRT